MWTDFFQYTPEELSAIILSLKVAFLCAAISLPPGIAIGWFLARYNFWGKAIIEGILHVPLVLPPITTGYLLLLLLGKQSFLGNFLHEHFGIQIAFSFPAAVLAALVVSFPLVTRSIRLSIELVDSKLEEAAKTLGAKPFRVFYTITLPLAMPGIVSGFILSFARSLGEFGATISFAGNISGKTRTLPLAIFSEMQIPGHEVTTARLVIVSLILSLSAMIAAEILNQRVLKNRHS